MRSTLRTTALIAALAITGLTGCSTGDEPSKQAADAPPPTPQATVTAPPVAVPEPTTEAPEPSATPESAQDSLAAFGDTWEYEDGISITVTVSGQTVASEYAAGAEPGAPVVLFDVTVTNNGSGIFDPTMVNSTVNYGTTTADRVFDSNLLTTFEGKVLPGGSLTETQGYAIADPAAEVLFSVAPDWEHEDALFFGTLTGAPAA